MSPTQNDYQDDLTQLSGIADATQEWLRETFQVQTYHDLAVLSVDEVAAKYKSAGKVTSRKAIESWITQAKALASSDKSGADSEQKTDWRTVALFFVEFKERVVDGETYYETTVMLDKNEKSDTWPGLEQHKWVEWIGARINVNRPVNDAQSGTVTLPHSAKVASDTKSTSQIETEPNKDTYQPYPSDDIDEQTTFSEELKNIIDKVKILANASSVPTSDRLTQPSSQLETNNEMDDTVDGEPELSASVFQFSEKLQQVIAKSRQLAGQQDN